MTFSNYAIEQNQTFQRAQVPGSVRDVNYAYTYINYSRDEYVSYIFDLDPKKNILTTLAAHASTLDDNPKSQNLFFQTNKWLSIFTCT